MAEQTKGPESDRGGRRVIGVLQLILIIAVVAVALYFARAPERTVREVAPELTDERAKPAVSVVRPSPTRQALSVRLTGSVKLDGRVKVASEVEGRVVWVAPQFSHGGSITANEAFVRVDPAQYELELEAAQMAVREAEARVRIERSRGALEAASFSSQRPGEEVPDFVRRTPMIELAEAALGKARAELGLARLRLERTSISLPYAGRVVRSDVEVGDLVGPADRAGVSPVLGVVYRTEALEVDAPIESRDLGYLAPAVGRAARVHVQGGTLDAEVARVSSVVSPKTRLASLFLEFPEGTPAESLPLPGTFVEVEIPGPTHENVYVLPESAVQVGGSVWVVGDGVLRSHVPGSSVAPPTAGWSRHSTRAKESSSAPCRGPDPVSRSSRRKRRSRSRGA